jgi:hypothetical protein
VIEEIDGSDMRVIGDFTIYLRPWSLFSDNTLSEFLLIKF